VEVEVEVDGEVEEVLDLVAEEALDWVAEEVDTTVDVGAASSLDEETELLSRVEVAEEEEEEEDTP
jgi:hypothetical protein